jgi:hypothetical protein
MKQATGPLLHKPSRRAWFFLVLGMLLFLVVWTVIEQGILPAYGWLSDQWHYGDSRITQLDANVGHGGESHFLAEYYHGKIVVIEIPLTPSTAYKVYTLTGMVGLTGTSTILLSVQDINHDEKPDLVIQVEGSSFEDVLFNTGTSFVLNGA